MSSIMTMPYLWFLTECTSFSFSIKYQVFRFSSSLVLGIRDSLETRLLGFVNAFRLVKVKRRICKVSVESSFPYLLYLNGLCVAIRPPPPPLRKKSRKSLRGGDGCTQTIYYLNFHTSEMVFFNISPQTNFAKVVFPCKLYYIPEFSK